jgi:hypothetical protein
MDFKKAAQRAFELGQKKKQEEITYTPEMLSCEFVSQTNETVFFRSTRDPERTDLLEIRCPPLGKCDLPHQLYNMSTLSGADVVGKFNYGKSKTKHQN